MDERTENLRDVFVDATGSETVTESQEESPGSLVDRDEAAVAERVSELIAAMRERYGFDTDLDGDAYERVVYGHFDGGPDGSVAAELDVDPETVRDARLDLHLVTDTDRDAPFSYDELKRLLAADRSPAECARALDVDVATVERYVDVARADAASTRANDRFRDEFRDLLTDAEIEGSHASDAREDGLEDATEDIETDVSL